MTHRDAKTLVSELEAARVLEAHGWRKVPCGECGAVGETDTAPGRSFIDAADRIRKVCVKCEGARFTWEKPPL